MKVEWFVENLIDEEKDGLKNVLKLLMNGWQFVKKEIKIVMEILWIMNEWENEYEWRDMDGISEPRIYEKKKNEWRTGKNFRDKIGVWQELISIIKSINWLSIITFEIILPIWM